MISRPLAPAPPRGGYHSVSTVPGGETVVRIDISDLSPAPPVQALGPPPPRLSNPRRDARRRRRSPAPRPPPVPDDPHLRIARHRPGQPVARHLVADPPEPQAGR